MPLLNPHPLEKGGMGDFSSTPMSPLALTMGDPSGIGGEITLKAFMRRCSLDLPTFFIIDDINRLELLSKLLGLDVKLERISHPSEAVKIFPHSLPILHSPFASPQPVIKSIEEAYALVSSGEAAAMVTNPIEKKALYDSGFLFPGHTEFLASLAGKSRVAMMLVSSGLRVVPVTIHCPVKDIANHLTTQKIIDCGMVADEALRKNFGIKQPRIAVAALNPHAGEGGKMGDEEERIIRPAIKILKSENINVFGPLPADSMFGEEARQNYDAALCMYHDQALIPIKTLDFWCGVNVTLGLGIVRTSPDHGTALDIAGKGVARPDSLIAALQLAVGMVGRDQ